MSIKIVRELGQMVNTTYDKALMSGTFAQSSKFDFSQYDSEVTAALLANTIDDFESHRIRSERAYQTLLEDLEVVKERALSTKSSSLIDEVTLLLVDIDKIKSEAITQKSILLKRKMTMLNDLQLEKKWAENKLKRSIYRKLTAIYDDAAEVGYNFRLKSEEKNKQNLKRIIWTLGVCVGMGLILSFGVSYLVISPLLKLQNVCKKVGLGDYNVRSDITSKDEMGTLASAFNSMLETIHEKDENISSLLSALPFGLFYFDSEGKISKERSTRTDLIFPNFSSFSSIYEFYDSFKFNTKQIRSILNAAFGELLDFESAVYLFPRTITVFDSAGNRTIDLSFKPKYGKKTKLERIIVIAEDVTEKNQAIARNQELTERVERISKISNDIPGFKDFLPAANLLFQKIITAISDNTSADHTSLRRDLHSLKGLLGIYSFSTCVMFIHDIEEALVESDYQTFLNCLNKFKITFEIFTTQSDDIVRLLSLSDEKEMKFYNASKIGNIQSIAIAREDTEILRALDLIDRFPIENVFAKYKAHASSIVEKMHDKKIEVVFDASDELSFEEMQLLDPVVTHILNNSIDHGIETQSLREINGKNPIGKITFFFRRNLDNTLHFKISDDGKGIDSDAITKKAISVGAITKELAMNLTEGERINLIFKAGLSSKEETTEISGRGIGLDAVKSHIDQLKGNIFVTTKINSGTTFDIIIPPLKNKRLA